MPGKYNLMVSVLLLIVMGSMILVTGCKDEEPIPVVPAPTIVEPRTPDELLAWFRTAYEDMDVEGYLGLLDEDFLFLLQTGTTWRIPELGGSLDFAEEERIHQRLFSGEAVVDPAGATQPAVLSVEIQQFQALDGWRPTDDVIRFPDAVWAPFSVDILYDCGPEYATHNAHGAVRIYIREYLRINNGKEIYYYRLAGMIDLTQSDKGVESTPWGLIKGFYR